MTPTTSGKGTLTLAASGAQPTEPCQRCKSSYPGGVTPWSGGNPECAFPGGGTFTNDNWNCATAALLRDLVGEFPGDVEIEGIAVVQNWDQKVATVIIQDGIDLEHYHQYIPALIMTWYKRRGRTDTILLLTDDGTAIVPTAADIEAICAGYAALRDGTGRDPSPPVIEEDGPGRNPK